MKKNNDNQNNNQVEENINTELNADEAFNEKEADEKSAAETETREVKNKELDELKDKYIRICAEYDNYRKRSDKEKIDAYSSGMTFSVKLFLPILDNLERALSFEPENEGVKMIAKQINEAFNKMGIEEIASDGKAFDPELHNAVMHEEAEDKPEQTVVETFQKGYTLNGKVIRHAMVKVVN